MDKLLIQNARVYQNGQFVRADVLCGDALIAKIGENLTDEEARVIQADGRGLGGGVDAPFVGKPATIPCIGSYQADRCDQNDCERIHIYSSFL